MIDVHRFDPFDDELLTEVHEAVLAAATREYDVPWSLPELAVILRREDPWTGHLALLARDATGQVIAVADGWLPLRDNTDAMWCDLWVRPGRHADAEPLLAWMLNGARERGRHLVQADADVDVKTRSSPLSEMLQRAGFELGDTDAHRILDLPAVPDDLARLAAASAPHHRAYRLITWAGACPEEWVEGYARLRTLMVGEAPQGDLQLENEEFDAARVRDEEARLAEQQRTAWTTAAVDGAGALVGHSQLIVPGTDTVNAFQWDTLVLPAHRGHRLGIATKVRNLQAAADALPPRTRLHTWNATSNTPMAAVNEAMGFRLVELSGSYQVRL